MKSQKQAVVDEVVSVLGSSFVLGKDNALSLLTNAQLESIKHNIASAIFNGTVAYSKSVANRSEVVAYARSMVMNHLKKAKELNGGATTKTNTPATQTTQQTPKASKLTHSKVRLPKGVNASLLSEEMIEVAASLVK